MKRVWNKSWKSVALAFGIVMIPTAALAATGAFTSATATPAVTGTNSSTASGAKGVSGSVTGSSANARYGVAGSATGTGGIGVQGTGTKYGVNSVGPLNATGNATFGGNVSIGSGKHLNCGACIIGMNDIAAGSLTHDLYNAGSVDNAALGDGSVTPSKLSPDAQSTVYSTGFATGEQDVTIPGSASFTTIGTLTLPAGSYVVNAMLNYTNNFASQSSAYCLLELGSISDGNRNAQVLDDIPANAGRSQSLTLTGTLAASSTAVLECTDTNISTSLILRDFQLNALRVGNMVNQ